MDLCYLRTSHLKGRDENAFTPSFTTNLEHWRNQNSLYSISIILRIKSLFLKLFCIYGVLTPCKNIHHDIQDSRRPEESVYFLRTGITDGFEPPCVCWELKFWKNGLVLLPAEPSFQPHRSVCLSDTAMSLKK